MGYDIEYVLDGYVNCALRSSMMNDSDYFDSIYTDGDLTEEARTKIRTDCYAFLALAETELDMLAAEFPKVDARQIGHDFWLTRNNHGSGFWDRGYGELGELLGEKAKSLGECGLYENDYGQVEIV